MDAKQGFGWEHDPQTEEWKLKQIFPKTTELTQPKLTDILLEKALSSLESSGSRVRLSVNPHTGEVQLVDRFSGEPIDKSRDIYKPYNPEDKEQYPPLGTKLSQEKKYFVDELHEKEQPFTKDLLRCSKLDCTEVEPFYFRELGTESLLKEDPRKPLTDWPFDAARMIDPAYQERLEAARKAELTPEDYRMLAKEAEFKEIHGLNIVFPSKHF